MTLRRVLKRGVLWRPPAPSRLSMAPSLREYRLREVGLRGDMYYKFSGFTQKLTGSWASAAYSPQGLKPVVSSEAPPIIFATPTKFASEAAPYDYAGKNKVPELQKFFQKSDGLPVHLKHGLPDQMLYRTTMALTLGGTIYCLIALYMASQPRNK